MQSKRQVLLGCGLLILAVGGVLALAQTQPANKKEEQERKVKEAEVPPTALTALKKLAGSATITEFSEEIEHGHKFYEGSWKGPDGNVDALVTEAGDVVEIEEIIPIDKAPVAVRAAAEKEAGKDAKLTFEKKTMWLYEVHFKKGDKGREIILTPDGRRYYEEGAGQGAGDVDDEDEDD
jgi:uncharacterized membrane protein YkoI